MMRVVLSGSRVVFNERALAFQSGASVQILEWNRLAAPGIHHRAPRCVLTEMSERTESYCDQQNREDSNRPALPTLLAFPCY